MLFGGGDCADYYETHDTTSTGKTGSMTGSILSTVGSWYHVAFGSIYLNGNFSGSASSFPNTSTFAVNTTRLFNHSLGNKTPANNQYGNVALYEVCL
jgi:hypothetical protein